MRAVLFLLLTASSAACQAGEASPNITTEVTGPDAFRLTLHAADTTDVSQGQQRLLPTARRLCGAKPVQFGRYVFEATQPLTPGQGSGPSRLTLRQAVSCGPPQQTASTPPSAPASDNAAIRALTERYFGALERGDYRQAYELMTPDMHGGLSLEEWAADQRRGGAEAGAPGSRNLVKLTWYDDPPGAPTPGTYVAVDYAATTEKLALECGYLMWMHQGGGRYRLVRQENGRLSKADAARMTPEELAQVGAALRCPA